MNTFNPDDLVMTPYGLGRVSFVPDNNSYVEVKFSKHLRKQYPLEDVKLFHDDMDTQAGYQIVFRDDDKFHYLIVDRATNEGIAFFRYQQDAATYRDLLNSGQVKLINA